MGEDRRRQTAGVLSKKKKSMSQLRLAQKNLKKLDAQDGSLRATKPVLLSGKVAWTAIFKPYSENTSIKRKLVLLTAEQFLHVSI